MKDIEKRLKALERQIETRNPGSIQVLFKDGHRERIHPGDSARLAIEHGEEIEHFEEISGSYSEIVGLANALLLDGEEMPEE